MNKEQVIDAVVETVRKMDGDAQEKYATPLNQMVVQGVITLVTLYKARKHAKNGDWLPAIYYAVLWSGITSNQYQNRTERLQQRKDHPKFTIENIFSSGDSAVGVDKPGQSW